MERFELNYVVWTRGWCPTYVGPCTKS